MSSDGTKSFGPLQGKAAVYVFVGLMLTETVIAFLTCSRDLALPQAAMQQVIKIFSIVITLGWLSYAYSKDQRGFFRHFLLLLILTSPIFAMVQSESGLWFWFSLIIISAIVIIDVWRYRKGVWGDIITVIYVLWVVIGVIVTIGNTSYFRYAESAVAIAKQNNVFLLDLRYFLATLFLILSMIFAVRKAFLLGVPSIPPLRLFVLPNLTKKHPSLKKATRPLSVILNIILLILTAISDIIWRQLGTVSIFLFHTFVNLAKRFSDLLTNGRVWLAIFRALITFLVILVIARLSRLASKAFYYYLTHETSIDIITTNGIIALLVISGFFIITLLGIFLICKFWTTGKDVLNHAIVGGAMVFITCALSGWIMYLLAWLVLKINGFNRPGLFSFIILIVLGFAILVLIWKPRQIQIPQSTTPAGDEDPAIPRIKIKRSIFKPDTPMPQQEQEPEKKPPQQNNNYQPNLNRKKSRFAVRPVTRQSILAFGIVAFFILTVTMLIIIKNFSQ